MFNIKLKKTSINKRATSKILATSVLAFLFLLSIFVGCFNLSTTTVKAQTTGSITVPSDMLQYGNPLFGTDPECTFYNAGPGPSSANIQWEANIPGVAGTNVGELAAFDGLVFVTANGLTYALDGGTGNVVWTSNITGMGVQDIDSTYMMIGSDCVTVATGALVWTGPPGFVPNQGMQYSECSYVPELQMFITPTYGWNLPNPAQPPTLAWNLTAQQNVGPPQVAVYGGGMMFSNGADYFLRAYNATTGQLLWTTPTTDNNGYGMTYYDGLVIHGQTDNKMCAWNATTGQLVWTYDPETYLGMWAAASGAAYGMIYEHNEDTNLYAVNATTGQLVWKASGPGVGYGGELNIADGMVYLEMGDAQYRNPATGAYGTSQFDCFNAYTGQLVWSLPVEDGSPFSYQAIAYGNLYLCPCVSTVVNGSWSYSGFGAGSIGQVWCISSTTTNWPMAFNDPEHTAMGNGPTNLTLSWKFQAGAGVVSSPTLVNGIAYFGSEDKNIYAVNATTGVKLWNYTTGFAQVSSPAVVNGMLYTGADDGNVYCLNANTGSLIWKTSAGGITNCLVGSGIYYTLPPIRSSPMVVGGNVYVGSLDGNLYCIDANSGTVLWKCQTAGPILATPTIVDGAVYFPSSTGGQLNPMSTSAIFPTSGDFYKLDANTGSVIWHIQIPYILNATYGTGNYLVASPTVANGMVFVRNGFLYTYALNATTGAFIWQHVGNGIATAGQAGGPPQVGAPLYAYGAIYITNYYDIDCLNAATGQLVWQTYLSRENDAYGLSMSYGRIYTVTQEGYLFVLDASSGAKLSYYYLGDPIYSMPTPYNGSLYVGCQNWDVYCFSGATAAVSITPVVTPTTTSPPSPTPTPTSAPSTQYVPALSWTSFWTATILVAAAIIVAIAIVGAAVLTTLKKRPIAKTT